MPLLNRILFLVNVVFIAALLLSYLSPSVNPVFFWPVSFFGLAYPVLLLINILFVIYWLIFGRLKLFLSLGAILLGYGHIGKFIQYNSRETAPDENMVKVVTFNAKLFGLFENRNTQDSVFSFIQKDKPDLVCFQEFYSFGKKDKNSVNRLKKSTLLKNSFFEVLKTGKKGEEFGLVTFSRYPIINKGIIEFENKTGNLATYCDVKIKKDTVRVYNVHLQSIRFRKVEYSFISKIPENKDEAIGQSKNILKRLKRAFEIRSQQAETLRAHINGSPYKVIICGDFNDTPTSFTYNTISSDLKDSFIESGSGIGNTYIGPFPSFRIDYILFDKSFKGYNYASNGSLFSDHKLVKTIIKLK